MMGEQIALTSNGSCHQQKHFPLTPQAGSQFSPPVINHQRE